MLPRAVIHSYGFAITHPGIFRISLGNLCNSFRGVRGWKWGWTGSEKMPVGDYRPAFDHFARSRAERLRLIVADFESQKFIQVDLTVAVFVAFLEIIG